MQLINLIPLAHPLIVICGQPWLSAKLFFTLTLEEVSLNWTSSIAFGVEFRRDNGQRIVSIGVSVFT